MSTGYAPVDHLQHPSTVAAFRTVHRLVACYAAISVASLVAIVLLRNTAEVNSAAWTRGIIVVASSLLTLAFARRAARGSSRAFLRLRIISAIMVVAVVAIIAVPGTFPLWMKIEQGVCGVLLACVVAIVNGRHLRDLFARR